MKTQIRILQPFFLILLLLTFLSACQNGSPKEEQKIVSTSVEKDSIITSKINLDYFHIFDVHPMENGKDHDSFISLSDIYTDSLSIPAEIIAKQKSLSFDELKHFELPATYREKLLKGTKLKENDTLYLYNYESNILEKFPIKDLKAVANLNIYTSEAEEISEYDYMIGFQLNKTKGKDYYTLAYFGNQNPFSEKPLKSIEWKKISADKFPVKTQHKTLKTGNVYHYQTEDLEYFIQDFMGENEALEKKLAVLKSGKLIFDKTYTRGEGAEFTTLEGIETSEYPVYQWTGNLFKGKPPVIFKFVSESFGCSEITFLDRSYPALYTNCDNRH